MVTVTIIITVVILLSLYPGPVDSLKCPQTCYIQDH